MGSNRVDVDASSRMHWDRVKVAAELIERLPLPSREEARRFCFGQRSKRNANLQLVQIKGFAEFIDDFGRHR
ncbi:hypothetical protein FF011L_37860 [Roseimaritima multifibrata]|uniref:Uncharacterized protein n=1 Tax=Roseimaritima multifibrata TaxID=1930274 RepID=A0A517MJD9_9BACT|nr:hypothetical protein FF011L_37860 [Roseimaritima multifibrata]